MRVLPALFFALVSAGCVGESIDDGMSTDEDDDPELAGIANDLASEVEPVDGESAETTISEAAVCTRHRYLHIANWSYVADLDEANGVAKNGCWGYQRRTSGFACDYSSTESDHIKIRDGGGDFASYNEIKPLNAHDAAAVANCRTQGGHPVRTYVVWNGSGFDREGIDAAVTFAEIYGTQSEGSTRFWTWYNGFRNGYAPMSNVSPETGIDAAGVRTIVKRMCATTKKGWVGLYFYDGEASGGPGMSEWKREAIIRAMNYCTTH